MDDQDSVRSFYKKLITLRKDNKYKETIVYGALEPIWEDRHNLMAYYRKGDKTLLVIGNYQMEEQTVTLPSPYKCILLNNYSNLTENEHMLTLQAYQVLILEM